MSLNQKAKAALEMIKNSGVEEAQVTFTSAEVTEIELAGTDINLCRSYFNDSYSAKVISKNRQAKGSVNQWDEASQKKLVHELKQGLEASPEDKAYSILQSQEKKSFMLESREADLEGMLQSFNEFIQWTQEKHPKIHFDTSPLKFIKTKQVKMNSHGLELEAYEDYYNCFVMFTAKKGKQSSSFNYVPFSTRSVPRNISELAGIDQVLSLTSRELEAGADMKGATDIVLTPNVLPDFLYYLTAHISSGSLMSGTSLLKGKLGERVISDKITLMTEPNSHEFSSIQPYTGDGLLTQDGHLFDQGVLKTYLIDLYGAHKLDMAPTPMANTNTSVAPGNKSFQDMIAGIENGILLTRFSGGSPSPNGDFSGVAKNSFHIKNGKIAAPLKETMIAGNFLKMFNEVQSVSSDRIHYGDSLYPWVHSTL